ncbi:hypothetical protein BBO99_00004673 [Phytophthora kernoviae]|uniref:Uncharacterized protein n=2 Tax=Phytophthora kernoviae TaxID=325452 RepID=A0A3F2RPK7_9STRA|nr:hypothetical protein G195_006810 [Phytophthora kernoviae 00238/432]KAG2527150.1 hypothetical protein JM18_003975 [Phytophthora kernoviae]KAG2528743.1 hypothetical protein JM16_002524 [Phytophthora kernoviae]RLN37939.1 hypothetical protein BBI17_002910 [Phytophthora kernoviae]RLN46855.1 hypothetical protein BBJ29_005819 [Phytophthora kernoviae]
MVEQKAVRWHKLPFTKFVAYEAKRPMFQPFLIGGVAALVICGVLPTRGASQEDKEKSNFWKRTNGKFDYSHH